MLSSALLLTLALLQSPLNSLRSTTAPGYGQVTALSFNGNQLIQARGPEITRYDLAQLLAGGLVGPSGFAPENAIIQRIPLEASVSSILALPSGALLVAGGDLGLFLIGRDGAVTRLEIDAGERWCADIAIAGKPGNFLVLWSAWDDTEVRSYSLAGTSAKRRGVVSLRSTSRGGVMRHPSRGYAIEVLGDSVYIAMGGSGLASATLGADGQLSNPKQGPVFHPQADASRWARDNFRAQDLSQVGPFLYVAAQSAGLIEINVDSLGELDEFSPYRRQASGPFSSKFLVGPPDKAFTASVDAVLDAAEDKIIVASGVLPFPSSFTEWGPYSPHGTFSWDLSPPQGDRIKTKGGPAAALQQTTLQLFERPSHGGSLEPIQSRAANDHARTWTSLAIHLETPDAGPDRLWFFDHLLEIEYSTRAPTGRFGPITKATPADFIAPRPTYTTGIPSKLSQGLILAGMDFNAPLPLLRIEEAASDLQIRAETALAPTLIPLYLQGSWLERGGPEPEEWFVAGSESLWSLFRLRADATDRLQLDRWSFRFPELARDLRGWDAGRGRAYSAAAIDPRPGADVLALSSSVVKKGVRLYSRAELMQAALGAEAQAPQKSGLRKLRLSGKRQLDTNPEHSDHKSALAFRTEYFEWQAGGDELVLGVAAGSFHATESPDFLRSKLALFRMGDCADLSSACTASQRPDASNLTLCIGTIPKALALAFATARVGDAQYAFVADSTGRVSAFDLTRAFSGSGDQPYTTLREVAHWDSPASTYDGFTTPITDLRVRFEEDPDGSSVTLFLYAAANRFGVARLRVTRPDAALGPLEIELVERINTPFQASGLMFLNAPVSGEPLLGVFDHFGGGVKIYGQATASDPAR